MVGVSARADPPTRPSARTSARPAAALPWPRWRFVHRWCGVLFGAWFALVGLTGAALVWRDALDAWLNPRLFTPQATGPALGVAEVLDRARGELGLGRVERIRPPAPGGVYRLQVRASAGRVESGRLEAFVDPASGALLGTRSLERRSLAPPDLLRTVYDFHRNLLLGEAGSNAVGLAGALLMASAASGLVLAWPRSRERWRKALRVAWRSSGTRVAFDLHRCTGLLLGAVLLLATLTGATLVYLNYVRDLVGLVSRVEPIPVLPFRTQAATQEPLGLDTLLAHVLASHPGQQLAELRLSERGLTGVQVHLRAAGDVHRLGDTIVWLHPYTGETLAERSSRRRSAGEQLMHWLQPLHVGSAFGTPGLVLMCAGGLAPLLLAGTGWWLWWRKRPGERRARQRATQRSR